MSLNNKNEGILFFDIETSYMKLADFQLANNGYIKHENILEDWSIYCAAWKFLGDKKVYSSSVSPTDIKNDYQVVKDIRDVLEKSKLVVFHNGDKFDLKKFNARLIYHRLPPIDHKILTFDTLKAAKRHFAFTSNRLDYLATFLNIGAKVKHGGGDPWLKLIKNKDTKNTLKHMVEYCKYDVSPLLEGVYLTIRPYVNHPNLNGFFTPKSHSEPIEAKCIHCGSDKLERNGTRVNRGGTLYQRYKCKEMTCGGWSQELIKSSPKVK